MTFQKLKKTIIILEKIIITLKVIDYLNYKIPFQPLIQLQIRLSLKDFKIKKISSYLVIMHQTAKSQLNKFNVAKYNMRYAILALKRDRF